jgi:uncharacterized protein (TIGR02453 family)
MKSNPSFSADHFAFLRDLSKNNRREWFTAHKSRYEDAVKSPALRFVTEVGPRLAKIAPSFLADPRPVGGSLFRIYRDTRFGGDKTPYKTHTGIQFRHKAGKDAHAPCYYLHLEPRGCFVAVGMWHPDAPALAGVRRGIVAAPSDWKKARDDRRFRSSFDLSGDALVRPPRGYDPEHPLIEDLKRKDFVAVAGLTERDVLAADFLERFIGLCRDGAPFVRFLCGATGVPF